MRINLADAEEYFQSEEYRGFISMLPPPSDIAGRARQYLSFKLVGGSDVYIGDNYITVTSSSFDHDQVMQMVSAEIIALDGSVFEFCDITSDSQYSWGSDDPSPVVVFNFSKRRA